MVILFLNKIGQLQIRFFAKNGKSRKPQLPEEKKLPIRKCKIMK
jgi:hypothetical protein